MTSTEDRRTLHLHLLTPVFIGSGEKLSRFEYVLEQSGGTQRILIADVNRMLEVVARLPGGGLVDRLESAALRGERLEDALQPLLRLGGGTAAGWLRQQRAVAEELQLDPAASPRISSGQTSAQPPQGRGPQGGAQRRAQTEYQIQRHLRTPDGRCYIPGSELKGSLRVAVLYRLLNQGGPEVDRVRTGLKQALEGLRQQPGQTEAGSALDRLKSAARHLDAQLLRLPYRQGDAKFDLFRFIHITDTGPVAADRVAVLSAEVQPVGGTSAGNRQGRIPMFIEALLPGTELECTLTVTRPDSALVRRWCEGRLPEHMRRVLSVDWLLEAWRQKSQAVLEADMAQADVLRPALGTLLQELRQGNTLLRVGWGQGLLATTVDLYIKKNWPNLYQDVIARLLSRRRQPSAAFPTSRRVAHCNGRLWPLGWIRLG
jgi:CRISPR-associated protein Csm5